MIYRFKRSKKTGKIRLTVEQHRHEKDEFMNVFKAPSNKFHREYDRLKPEHAWVLVWKIL